MLVNSRNKDKEKSAFRSRNFEAWGEYECNGVDGITHALRAMKYESPRAVVEDFEDLFLCNITNR